MPSAFLRFGRGSDVKRSVYGMGCRVGFRVGFRVARVGVRVVLITGLRVARDVLPAIRAVRNAAVFATHRPPPPPEPRAPIHDLDRTAASRATVQRDPLGAGIRDGLVITGATPHRLILFTFDDGPDRETTPRLLDHLDRTGVKGVFFLTAERIGGANRTERAQIAIAQDIVRRGHSVGSHTVHHAALPSLNDAQVFEELVGAEEIFVRVFGARPWLLRPPYGVHSERVDALIASREYTQIVWNLGTGDFLAHDEHEVLDLFQKKLAIRERDDGQRGGIILLHDTHPWSVAAYLLIHAELMARNCALLERNEELYDIVDDVRMFHVERAGADPSLEAPPLQLPPEILAARQARLRTQTMHRCRALASR